MFSHVIRALAISALLVLAGCGSLPRGAALQKEVTRGADAQDATFQLVKVSNENVDQIADWPVTGWSGAFRWIKTSRGPKSQTLRIGDKVDLTIWDNQQNSLLTQNGSNMTTLSALVVSPNGTIFVPYVGDVVVNGLTADGARDRIQRELTPIAPDAQVQLASTPGVGNSVSVLGGVGAPGAYPLPNRNTMILTMLATAGGIKDSMRNPVVTMSRAGQKYSIPARDLYDSPDKNTRLYSGDQIIVQNDERAFTSLGASGSESLIYFPKEYVTAMEAMSLMGGINDARADPKGILVLREYPADAVVPAGQNGPEKNQVIFSLNLTTADGLFAARNFLIHPNDTVLATESPVVALQTIFGLFGSLVGATAQANNLANNVSN